MTTAGSVRVCMSHEMAQQDEVMCATRTVHLECVAGQYTMACVLSSVCIGVCWRVFGEQDAVHYDDSGCFQKLLLANLPTTLPECSDGIAERGAAGKGVAAKGVGARGAAH